MREMGQERDRGQSLQSPGGTLRKVALAPCPNTELDVGSAPGSLSLSSFCNLLQTQAFPPVSLRRQREVLGEVERPGLRARSDGGLDTWPQLHPLNMHISRP